MMAEGKDDDNHLGLSLGLSFHSHHHHHHHPLQLNLMPAARWINDASSSDGTSGSLLRGIDVNRMPTSEEEEMSSPNSTLSSVSGKRSEPDQDNNGELDADEEDAETCRKKLRLTKDQSAVLEDSFKEHNTLNPKQKLGLAKKLGLRPRQVEVWFQNRRARTKLKQTEVDCEFLKRWCENLTDENRRLQKEVLELRALKHSPQFYMHMAPPTTLTMCPSCERIGPAQLHQARPIHINPWASVIPARPFNACT